MLRAGPRRALAPRGGVQRPRLPPASRQLPALPALSSPRAGESGAPSPGCSQASGGARRLWPAALVPQRPLSTRRPGGGGLDRDGTQDAAAGRVNGLPKRGQPPGSVGWTFTWVGGRIQSYVKHNAQVPWHRGRRGREGLFF